MLRLDILLILIVAAILPAHSSPPYKVTISGPGLAKTIEIPGFDSEAGALISTLNNGMASTGEFDPPPHSLIYEVNWYWDYCWANDAACQDGDTVYHTLYAFSLCTGMGYLLHVDDPGWLLLTGDAAHQWQMMRPEFDAILQRVLVEHGVSLKPWTFVVRLHALCH